MQVHHTDDEGYLKLNEGDAAIIFSETGLKLHIPSEIGDDEANKHEIVPQHVVFAAAVMGFASADDGVTAIAEWFESQTDDDEDDEESPNPFGAKH